ncbi:hypothetical protein GUITHDRAFT_148070 [Guillardia theta CCMP2712]|uniref:RRM domain-containing protein n=1 Tax=Guillardia theta (strain CCMP2712) TaxID=905079 RepID=L1IBL2_GUITC|nr:hypothetical protein GUITHDRAFT_148070 [Guillardia theta CCMP2712]EKX33230.1 hypothetical protein GUITHDRAFT_148070 [Guillardia theta CCMP2712]|eukprot:XP_005820210.1 hypothetical protein GUITHDRAFT_148070 [Guillardia theta CCMP2712]
MGRKRTCSSWLLLLAIFLVQAFPSHNTVSSNITPAQRPSVRLRGGVVMGQYGARRSNGKDGWKREEFSHKGSGTSSKLFPLLITGLGETSSEDIQELFADCGRVALVKRAGASKERVIVYFESRAALSLANNVNGTELQGVKLRSFSLPPVERSSLPQALSDHRGPEERGYPVVVNEVPLSVQESEIMACANKIGEIIKVKQDKKQMSSWWVTFKEKKAARTASKHGMGFGPTHCKVVRVRPEAGNKNVQAKEKKDKKTALIKGIPMLAKNEEIMALFKDFGKIETLRFITTPDPDTNLRRAFISFATKTALKKARKASLSLHGSKIGGCNTVIVKNLPYTITRDKIRALFTPCGHVKAIRLIGKLAAGNNTRTPTSGREAFKGMAYVEFDLGRSNKLKLDRNLAMRNSVQAALQLEGTELMGRKIRVDWAHGPKALDRTL